MAQRAAAAAVVAGGRPQSHCEGWLENSSEVLDVSAIVGSYAVILTCLNVLQSFGMFFAVFGNSDRLALSRKV